MSKSRLLCYTGQIEPRLLKISKFKRKKFRFSNSLEFLLNSFQLFKSKFKDGINRYQYRHQMYLWGYNHLGKIRIFTSYRKFDSLGEIKNETNTLICNIMNYYLVQTKAVTSTTKQNHSEAEQFIYDCSFTILWTCAFWNRRQTFSYISYEDLIFLILLEEVILWFRSVLMYVCSGSYFLKSLSHTFNIKIYLILNYEASSSSCCLPPGQLMKL